MSTLLRLSFALAAMVAMSSSCFDGDELTDGLKCTQESHCGPGLNCINLVCQDPDDVCADTLPCPTDATNTEPTMSGGGENTCASLGDSCAAGEVCCEGSCFDVGAGDLRCVTTCGSGTECADTCCCQVLGDTGVRACVETSVCGSDATCSPGCAALGSACYSDSDCCGGFCLDNGSGFSSCFTQ